jgi:hypothetical protein
LLGRHAAAPCADCHKPAAAATVYRVPFAACTNCHKDPHQGQLTAAGRCEDCHTVERFRPAVFTLARHDRTRFPLRGAHAAVSCVDCHSKGKGRPEEATYRFTDLSCGGCHADPHRGEFASRMAVKNAAGAAAGCEACHTDRTWRDIAKFDHATTRFPLTGSHRAAACERCHAATALSTGLRQADYSRAPLECAGCHPDIHGGQFAAIVAESGCAACHTTGKWKPATFDHSRTRFALTGAHAGVPCGDCHKTLRETAGRMVLFYKPVSLECSSCHGPNTAK